MGKFSKNLHLDSCLYYFLTAKLGTYLSVAYKRNTSIMRGSHIADYYSRLRSDSDTTRNVKKSEYYP